MSARGNTARQGGGVAIAHVSDVHLSPLGFPPLSHLNVKTGLGYLNWHLRRKMFHDNAIVERLIADMKAHAPDHILVSGDIVNMALPREFDRSEAWLASVGAPSDVSVVPGNHDIYASWRDADGVARWSAYMRGDADETASAAAGRGIPQPDSDHGGRHGLPVFPYVRRIGDVALIGVNSAVPTMPFNASGGIAIADLVRLEALLQDCGQRGLFRLVMLHHPPLPGQSSPNRGLREALALSDLFQRVGVELVVHGHAHRDSLVWGETGSDSRYPVIGVASASCNATHGAQPIGRYNLYVIQRAAPQTGRSGWIIDVMGRGPEADGGPLIERERYRLVNGVRLDAAEIELEPT